MKKIINLSLSFSLISVMTSYAVSCKDISKINESLESQYAMRQIFANSENEESKGYENIFFEKKTNTDDNELDKEKHYFKQNNSNGYDLESDFFSPINAIGQPVSNTQYNEPDSIWKNPHIKDKDKEKYTYKYQISIDTIASNLNIKPSIEKGLFYNFKNTKLFIEPGKAHYSFLLANDVDQENSTDNRLIYSVNYEQIQFYSSDNKEYSTKVKLNDLDNTFKISDFTDKTILNAKFLEKEKVEIESVKQATNDSDNKLVFTVKKDKDKKNSSVDDVKNVENSLKYFINNFNGYAKEEQNNDNDKIIEKKTLLRPFKIENNQKETKNISEFEIQYFNGEAE